MESKAEIEKTILSLEYLAKADRDKYNRIGIGAENAGMIVGLILCATIMGIVIGLPMIIINGIVKASKNNEKAKLLEEIAVCENRILKLRQQLCEMKEIEQQV